MESQTVQIDLPLVSVAAAHAADLGHPFVAPEHLLLAITSEPAGIARAFFQNHGIVTETVRQALTDLLGPSTPIGAAPPRLAHRSIVALAKAVQAGRAGTRPYSQEDLLAALLSADVADGAVIEGLLKSSGLTPAAARDEIQRLRAAQPAT